MYGDYDGPNKADKGQSGGSCNRTRCQASPANYWNHGSYSWYCLDCAVDIGQDHVNLRGWMRDHYPSCGHAMFETQAQMDAREQNVAQSPEDEAAEMERQSQVAVKQYLARVTELQARPDLSYHVAPQGKQPKSKNRTIRH